jgi:glycosyltransferase involved in cell wall biosynthesis
LKISVIVPSYNQGLYLDATLRSILDQSYVGTEVIVKDGGSTDNSVEILRSFGNRIRWRSARDRGQTDAINQGLREATGEIVAYLNSDDVYLPDALTTVAAYFTAHPECQILFGDALHLHADGSVMEPYPTQPWDYNRLFETCYICQPAAFWRRSLQARFGYFDETLHYSMDYEFWLRVGAREPLHHLAGWVLAGSRLHGETKTLRHRVPFHREILQVIQQYANRPDQSYGWLKHLASLRARDDGFHPSADPRTHAAHVRQFCRHVLTYAEQYRIAVDEGLLAELDELLSTTSYQP